MQVLSAFLEFLFPTPCICVICGTKQKQLSYCETCCDKNEWHREHYGQCRRCGTFGVRAEVCDTCRNWPQYYTVNHAFWPYQDAVRDSISAFKYRREPWRGRALAQAILQLVPSDASWLVPVPLHPRRFRERGYNQSALICDELHKMLGIPVAKHALLRVVDTPHQVGLSRAHRARNLAQAFAPGPELNQLQGHVVLVDDVLTTGTTMVYCMRILRQSKASQLSSLSLAAGVR